MADINKNLLKNIIDIKNTLLEEKIIDENIKISFNEKERTKLLDSIKPFIDKNIKSYDNLKNIPINEAEKIILDEIIGLGPIQPLINDKDISEVMVNSSDKIYIEKKGKIEEAKICFFDNNHVISNIKKIARFVERRIDTEVPILDARLPDGSRINAIIHPLALTGPTLTIRKFEENPYTVDNLINFGSLTRQIADFLKGCVEGRLNIIISGGTGSGKTTLLNVLSSFIPPRDRVVTIEDAAELKLRQEHVITLESRPPDLNGRGEITIQNLVRNSLRMRPDRIVVGEVRGKEALDMLQAMNTGHDGSLTTIHANSPRDTLSRIETMVLMSGIDLPVKAIREQIASAINLIVQIQRLPDGSRKIISISEIVGMEMDKITMVEIFKFQKTGLDNKGIQLGKLVPTGLRPSFTENLETKGIMFPSELFG